MSEQLSTLEALLKRAKIHISPTITQLEDARAKRATFIEYLTQLSQERNELLSELYSLRSELAALMTSASNDDDDDDDSSSIQSQAQALRSRINQVENNIASVDRHISQTQKELSQIQNDISLHTKKLEECYRLLEDFEKAMTKKLREFIQAKEALQRAARSRSAQNSANDALARLQNSINRCMKASNELRELKQEIANTLGSEHNVRERELGQGYSK